MIQILLRSRLYSQITHTNFPTNSSSMPPSCYQGDVKRTFSRPPAQLFDTESRYMPTIVNDYCREARAVHNARPRISLPHVPSVAGKFAFTESEAWLRKTVGMDGWGVRIGRGHLVSCCTVDIGVPAGRNLIWTLIHAATTLLLIVNNLYQAHLASESQHP